MSDIPDLVGTAAAARILRVSGPHIVRLRRRGRLRAIPIDGASGDAYLRSEVEALAAEMQAERAARERRKATG